MIAKTSPASSDRDGFFSKSALCCASESKEQNSSTFSMQVTDDVKVEIWRFVRMAVGKEHPMSVVRVDLGRQADHRLLQRT